MISFPPVLVLLLFVWPCTSSFEPYKLNGGLVSAVAGKGFVVIACDTRLSDGYEILSRDYLSSRIWRVGSSGSRSSLEEVFGMKTEANDGASSLPSAAAAQAINAFDGAFVASAGCASDCEALKRQMKAEVIAHTDWGSGGGSLVQQPFLGATGVATLLGNSLYGRRGFPFYAFCIVGGIDASTLSGVVHVYDAIGSHERVAVAAAGSGKEMLQPILDRLFSVSNLRQIEANSPETDESDNTEKVVKLSKSSRMLRRDGSAVAAKDQRVGLGLSPPVKTNVECTCEEAVALLVRGYRSVAEREISVGDKVLVCVVKCNKEQGRQKGPNHVDGGLDTSGTLQVLSFPLKKH